MTEPRTFTDNAAARRYELAVEGGVVVATYNLVDGGVMITETLTPVGLEGKGHASALAGYVLADIEARGLKILPVCPFFADWLKRHPEHAGTVHPTYRQILGLQAPSASD
ncbi:MAG: GNAT family N-acetyltransferase [Brevundimonas sp.]